MNFFFHTPNDFVTSTLTIPKFQNSGKTAGGLNLYQAGINNGEWEIKPAECHEDDYFWSTSSNASNENSIYFLATSRESEVIATKNSLSNLNKFTDTSPDFRANLKVSNSLGATSSYQSEYPFRMTQKLGTLYSDCGMLTSKDADKVGVFLRNIFFKPEQKNATLYLYDNNLDKLLKTFTICTNKTCFIDLTPFNESLFTSFLFANDYLGIPIYLVDYGAAGLSFEHTHPPHESIHGANRFQMVNRLKEKAYEKVS